MLNTPSRRKLLQRIKEDCIWFLGKVNKRISKVSILAIDNEKVYESDKAFLKDQYEFMPIRIERRDDDFDADLFSGMFIEGDNRPVPCAGRFADRRLVHIHQLSCVLKSLAR